MFVSEALKTNSLNHLEIGGCDTVELVEKYGTPLYVMDEGLIRKNCRLYKDAMDKYYKGNGMVLYASKAFSSMAIYKIVESEGLGIDVVSGGELYTAYKAGFPMNRVYFHGNNKTIDEIELAIDKDVRRIVVDNLEELKNIDRIAGEKGKKSRYFFQDKAWNRGSYSRFCPDRSD